MRVARGEVATSEPPAGTPTRLFCVHHGAAATGPAVGRGRYRGLVTNERSTPPLGVHSGAREDDADPVAEARASGADAVQIFLADPQGWKAPKPHPHAEALQYS